MFSTVGRHQLLVLEAAEKGEAFARRTFIPTTHAVSEAWTTNGLLKHQAVTFAKNTGMIEYIPMDTPRNVRIVLTEAASSLLGDGANRAANQRHCIARTAKYALQFAPVNAEGVLSLSRLGDTQRPRSRCPVN